MISHVIVTDYQALKDVTLKLGKLTVVTGPTGSGKSAVIRALRLVAFNARGTSYIRHGTQKAGVALTLEDTAVGITRGRGQDKYTVASPESRGGILTEDYTKLEGKVPDPVRRLLALSDVSFAGQHDLPFLLADSGSAVARTLGELTNVTLLFDAAREANRRKLEISRELKLRQADLARLTSEAQAFRTLKDRKNAALEAAVRLEHLKLSTVTRDRLLLLYDRWYQADLVVGELEMGLDETVPPDTGELDSLQGKLARLRTLYARHGEAARAERQWSAAADAAARDVEQAHEDLHAALVAAGTCPTCGQSVGELHDRASARHLAAQAPRCGLGRRHAPAGAERRPVRHRREAARRGQLPLRRHLHVRRRRGPAAALRVPGVRRVRGRDLR